jgi:hypothetical protein
VPFSICRDQDDVFKGEIFQQTIASAQLAIPQGISQIEVRVSGLAAEQQPNDPYQCIVKLDSLEITGTEPLPAGYVPRLSVQTSREAHAGVHGLISGKDL